MGYATMHCAFVSSSTGFFFFFYVFLNGTWSNNPNKVTLFSTDCLQIKFLFCPCLFFNIGQHYPVMCDWDIISTASTTTKHQHDVLHPNTHLTTNQDKFVWSQIGTVQVNLKFKWATNRKSSAIESLNPPSPATKILGLQPFGKERYNVSIMNS